MVALGEIADIVSGATPKTGVAEYWDGEVHWVTPADLSRLDGPYIGQTPRSLTAAGVKSCATRILPTGSVLLSSRAPIGHVAINTAPMATNQGFKSLVPGADVDAKYLYHWLKSQTVYLQSLGNGATFKELSKRTTEQIRVPLPLLQEQRRIAAILDHADALRAKRRQAVTHLDSLVVATFVEMFRDDPVRPVGELVDFYSGGTPSKARTDLWQGQLSWFSAKDLKAADLHSSQDRVSEAVPSQTSIRLLAADTIVIVVRGMILAHTFPVSTLRIAATINQDLKALIPRIDVQADFLATALRAQASWVLARVTTAAHGTKKLESRVLKSIPVPDVSRGQQEEFARFVRTANHQQQIAQRALASVDELFAALQSRAFRGEL